MLERLLSHSLPQNQDSLTLKCLSLSNRSQASPHCCRLQSDTCVFSPAVGTVDRNGRLMDFILYECCLNNICIEYERRFFSI